MATKQEIQQLVEELSEVEASLLLEMLRAWATDPMMAALREAPEDDEPTTPEEDEGAEAAWQEYRRGEALSSEQAKALLLR